MEPAMPHQSIRRRRRFAPAVTFGALILAAAALASVAGAGPVAGAEVFEQSSGSVHLLFPGQGIRIW
jgi:hypothetical protein